MIITDATFLARIETFLERHGMSATRFGEEAASDRHFVRRLRSGRSVTLRKAQRVCAYMADFEATKEAA